MDPNSEVVAEQNAGLLSLILQLLKLPVNIIRQILRSFIPQLLSKELNNCLPGKVVLITGASSGLGEAMAHVFYRAGCKVVLAARRQDELERVRRDLMNIKCDEYKTHQPIVIAIDVSDINSIPTKIDEILKIHGHIDLLINNAGMSVRSEIVNTEMKVDIQLMLVNYFGAIALTKACLPSMIRRKQGRIVFISSVQGKFGIPERSSYAASKHAMQAFSECLRAEVARHNVKVTIVSAGYIKTNLSLNAVTGSGESYGKLDKDTENGVDPLELARDILQAVLNDEKDVFTAHFMARAALKIHYYLPSLFFWIMEKRAAKLALKNSKS